MLRLVGGWDAGEVAVLLGLVAFVGVVEHWLLIEDGRGTEESKGGGLFKGVMGSASMSDEFRSVSDESVSSGMEFFFSTIKGELGSWRGVMIERSGGKEVGWGGACIEVERGTLD